MSENTSNVLQGTFTKILANTEKTPVLTRKLNKFDSQQDVDYFVINSAEGRYSSDLDLKVLPRMFPRHVLVVILMFLSFSLISPQKFGKFKFNVLFGQGLSSCLKGMICSFLDSLQTLSECLNLCLNPSYNKGKLKVLSVH